MDINAKAVKIFRTLVQQWKGFMLPKPTSSAQEQCTLENVDFDWSEVNYVDPQQTKVTDTDAKAIHIVRNHWWNVFDDELKELAEQAETTPAWYKDGKIDWSWFNQLDESSIKQFGPFTCALTYHGTPMVKHDSDADFTEIDGDCVNQYGDAVIYKPGAILVYHDKTNTFILHKL